MPIGKHKGQRIGALPTPFLAWFISQDNLRFKYGDTARAVVTELRERFRAPGQVEAELLPTDASDLV